MTHEGRSRVSNIYYCVPRIMPGAALVVRKYLLSGQMSNPILIPHVGHSQELGGLKTNAMTINLVIPLRCYRCA